MRKSSESASGNLQAAVPQGVENTVALGKILYTEYVYVFQLAGLILFVAMIGAIVLTLRHRPTVKRQIIRNQINRESTASIQMIDVLKIFVYSQK